MMDLVRAIQNDTTSIIIVHMSLPGEHLLYASTVRRLSVGQFSRDTQTLDEESSLGKVEDLPRVIKRERQAPDLLEVICTSKITRERQCERENESTCLGCRSCANFRQNQNCNEKADGQHTRNTRQKRGVASHQGTL